MKPQISCLSTSQLLISAERIHNVSCALLKGVGKPFEYAELSWKNLPVIRVEQ
jgi:hypothetical protein